MQLLAHFVCKPTFEDILSKLVKNWKWNYAHARTSFPVAPWKNHGTCSCPTHAASNPIASNPIIQTSTVQGHPGSKFIVSIESPLVVCYLTSPTLYLSPSSMVTIFEIFAAKILDLDLGQFRVVQSQSSWRQSVAHAWFPILLLLIQELIIEMRNPNVNWRIILPVYLFTTELRHTCIVP